jgi:hypothetical protein
MKKLFNSPSTLIDSFILKVTPVSGPNPEPMSFQVNIAHQLPDSAKYGLPGAST